MEIAKLYDLLLWKSPRAEVHDTSLPGQNGRHFAAAIFKRIFLNENVRISIHNSLRFVSKRPNDNKSVLV